MQALSYRQNVAIVVVNSEGRILCCHRSDMDGIWQIPQGGIEQGEVLSSAMLRELREEIGTDAVEILGQLENPIRYQWPEELRKDGYIGQEQYYFLVRLEDKGQIDLQNPDGTAEFDRFEWVTADEFLKRLSGFKKEAYTTAVLMLKKLFPNALR